MSLHNLQIFFCKKVVSVGQVIDTRKIQRKSAKKTLKEQSFKGLFLTNFLSVSPIRNLVKSIVFEHFMNILREYPQKTGLENWGRNPGTKILVTSSVLMSTEVC